MASTLLRSAVVIATGLFASLIYRGYQQRKLFRRTVAEYGGVSSQSHLDLNPHPKPKSFRFLLSHS
jgi:hypothetical protein